MPRKADEALENSQAGWTSPSPKEGRSVLRAFAPLLIGGTLAASAWHASGAYFENEARQGAADRWDQLRVCLLGDALLPSDKPSERVRFIRLAEHPGGENAWPERCLPYAEALDEALEARAILSRIGPMPSAVDIVKGTDDEAHRSDLDLLFAELEMADLPLPKHGTIVPAAPAPAKPLFAREDLKQLGKVLELRDVATSFDPTTGEALRVLLPEAQPQTCLFGGGEPSERWRTLVCHASPLTMPRDAKLTLAPTEKGGMDLIRVRDSGETDGIYDAATGLQVLRPRYFDTQTHVAADGSTTIVYAKLRDDSKLERVEHFRLLQSRPGKRPESRRLKVPTTARLLLLPDHLLWSVQNSDAKKGDDLIGQALTGKRNKPLGKPQTLASLPRGSRFLARCADGGTTALLFGAGMKDRRYTLLFKGPKGFTPPHDVGTIAGRVTMSCHEGKAMLQRIRHKRVSRWQCDAETCQLGLSDPLPMLDEKVHTVAPVGASVAVVWKDERGALRMRVAAPDALAATQDTVVLDDWHQGGVEMTGLELVSGGGLGVLLSQDVGRRIYALRIDPKGGIEPIAISR